MRLLTSLIFNYDLIYSLLSIIITDCPPGTFFTLESCIKCAKGEFQQHWNERTCAKCTIVECYDTLYTNIQF
jgi:hypothetical protein